MNKSLKREENNEAKVRVKESLPIKQCLHYQEVKNNIANRLIIRVVKKMLEDILQRGKFPKQARWYQIQQNRIAKWI